MANNIPMGTMSLPTNSSVDTEDLSILVQELRELGFDAIRFASYRTAAKLRYIQKKSCFLLIDLWNAIEGFRENGLNGLDPYSIITVPKLESVVTSLYQNLNKRLPVTQQVDVLSCARYFLSWLLIAYDSEGSGRVRVFSVKVGLITLCSGKLVDKLRYIFSLISDSNGCLVLSRFSEYLQEVLALPAMVLETQTFGYTEGLAATIFDGTSKVSVNGFLDALLNDPGPPNLMWLSLMHSMANVEEVSHGVQCSVCKVGNIQGFRYKCLKCSNFNMCQNCFWQGKTTENHRTDHEVKEITCKSGGKGLRSSFRKSLRCVPDKPRNAVPRFPEEPERCLNLSHIVPPSPMPLHNGFGYDVSLDPYSDLGPSRVVTNTFDESDEHQLIRRYTARLASDCKYPSAAQYHSMQRSRTVSQNSMSLFDSTQSQRDLITQLEARNRDIMKEIALLKAQQESEYLNGGSLNPVMVDELQALREYKVDLEGKLNGLQDSRRQLMGQLEGLMRVLKLQQLSPNGTPESSPGTIPPMPIYSQPGSLHRSAPATPHHSSAEAYDPNFAFGNMSDTDFSTPNSSEAMTRSLRDDLLMAADSVTNAMSSLVKELHADEDNVNRISQPFDFDLTDSFKPSSRWKKDMEARILDEEEEARQMELRRRKFANGSAYAVPNGSAKGKSSYLLNHYNTFSGHMNGSRNAASLERRRRSFGNDEIMYDKAVTGSSQSRGNNGELSNGNGADWEDGLQRRVK